MKSQHEATKREVQTYDRDNLLSDCGRAAALLLSLNIATLLGFLGEFKFFRRKFYV